MLRAIVTRRHRAPTLERHVRRRMISNQRSTMARQRISTSSLAKTRLELPKHKSCKTEDSHHYHRYPISSGGSIAEDSADRSKCDDWKRNLEQAPGDALASEGGQHDEDQHRSTVAPRTPRGWCLRPVGRMSVTAPRSTPFLRR